MKRFTFLASLLMAVAVAAVAHAGITVFKTSFQSRSDFESIRSLSGPGKQCKRDWRDKSAVGVTVKGGPVNCAASTPVQGDAALPVQTVRVVAKVNKETDDSVSKSAYVGVIARASGKESYELRVFPKARSFELLKSGEVLQDGREKAVEGLAAKNRLQIDVIGDTVTAKVNGTKLASFKDKDAEQVEGRQTGLSFGIEENSKKGVAVALFDKLKIQIPVP
ncbi:MAG: hypothetical protein ABIZ50_02800 [Solirubrobacterales bacterium]